MNEPAAATDSTSYMVVARRYRPRTFCELIGQDHIAHALGTAIESGRVGHAYLFTGARGVGKTSSARIFAKALNAAPSIDGELAADISQAIDAGNDMDVIEIDGASNRGIEEIRQLRANVNVRPSRARYKIYIIDEVHMLTNQAFNALLKTLEEPPAHVKFIFCTTDPDKIPITVLSRCQRFDFVPIKLDDIQARLRKICDSEGYAADEEALALLARRAAGSMRDSQSLLEQVMSFSTQAISVEQVQQLLGIADEGRLLALTETLANCDALHAIRLIDEAARSGADAGQLAEQLLNYFRDLMAVGIGGEADLLKLANPAGHGKLKEIADRWGLQSILSAIQILDESLVRMRTSVSASALLEVALVQICQLPSLASIPALLEAILDGSPDRSSSPQSTTAAASAAAKEKKNFSEERSQSNPLAQPRFAVEPVGEDHSPPPHVQPVSLPVAQRLASSVASATILAGERDASVSTTARTIAGTPPPPALVLDAEADGSSTELEQWRKAVSGIDDLLADYAQLATSIIPGGSGQWTIVFPPEAQRQREYCEQPQRKSILQAAIAETLGRSIRLLFTVQPADALRPTQTIKSSHNRVQQLREVSENPFVKKICEALDGEILRVDPPDQNINSPPGKA